MNPLNVGCMQLLLRLGAMGEDGLRPCAEPVFGGKLVVSCVEGELAMPAGWVWAKPSAVERVVVWGDGLASSSGWACPCDW
jgi:hypothetical protein